MPGSRSRFFAAALAFLLCLAPVAVQARAGFGGSFGSRGFRTFSMPHYTPLAPRGASPIGRSMTRPSFGSGYGARPFGSGLGRGFLGGLLGAGLFGLLFGGGFFGGVGGIGSLFGLVLQILLLFFLFRLAMRWFSSRQPGFAANFAGGQTSSVAPGLGSGQAYAPSQPLTLAGEDFNAFENLLQQIQGAFAAEDLDKLRMMTTPEMASYFAEQLAQNARRGVVNRIADVRLVKGDLSEAWRDPQGEFATVAMQFALRDWTIERQSGRIVEGEPSQIQEVTEIWTFRRNPGESPRDWKLSAIQQA